MGTVAVTAWQRPIGGAVPTGGVGRGDTRGHPLCCASSVLRWPASIHAWVSWTSSPGDDRAITWGVWSGRWPSGGQVDGDVALVAQGDKQVVICGVRCTLEPEL